MGYGFVISKEHAYKVKEKGEYPWPIRNRSAWNPGEDGSKRTITLYTNDVLTKDPETGLFMKQTGLGCFGIVLQDHQVEMWGHDISLQML